MLTDRSLNLQIRHRIKHTRIHEVHASLDCDDDQRPITLMQTPLLTQTYRASSTSIRLGSPQSPDLGLIGE